ncbi:MAG: GNAT family N-acetyltransferase [Anaerolineales bacterium]
MSAIEVRPLRTARDKRTFLTFPWRIYRDDPLWVPPLLPERAKVIDPKRGSFFNRGGKAAFFIAWRDGRPVGTICAAEDPFSNQRVNRQDCVFGFFECIEDYQVAQALFAQAQDWARGRGLASVWGPFNLDYEDGYGILIEGRDRPPVILCGHTPVYYQDFVERYGFEQARGDNIAFAIPVEADNPQVRRLSRLADRLRAKGKIRVRPADFENWEQEADHVHRLLNHSLTHLEGHIGWHRDAVRSMLQPFLQIADPELILFAEIGGEVVGWFPGIPNINEWTMHANGLRRPWDALRLLWHSRRHPKCVAIKSVLVLPEYWDTGVAVLLFDELAQRVRGKGYTWADLSLTSEDNPRTPVLAERFGAKIYKRYRVYRIAV